MVSKVFEKLLNNRVVDHLEKCDLFPDFQHGLLCQLRNLLTVVSDIIVRAFNKSGAAQAVALDISKAFGQCLTCWYSSYTHILWNFRSDVWPYFFFSQ